MIGINCLSVLLVVVMLLSFGGKSEMNNMKYDVTNKLTRFANGVRNPLKGLRADKELDDRFGSLIRWYIEWNKIEANATDGVQSIVSYGKDAWGCVNEYNGKIIPRVYLEWPNVGKYWPEDLNEGDYTSPEFQKRLRNMVKKMAEAWDNDPRIAYIEMGLIGYWGEQHTPNPTEEVQNVLIEAFHEYFKNKLVMVRYPKCTLYDKGNFGMYWDEWGSEMQWSVWDEIDLVLTPKYKDRWKTQVYGGENTNNLYTYDPDGGRFMTFGCSVPFDEITAFTQYLGEMKKYARLIHANHMHTRVPNGRNGLAYLNACSFQDTLGYAFTISEAAFSHIDSNIRQLDFTFNVKNEGSSPLYYDWPVRVSLLDKNNNSVVWNDLIDGVSASDWMPGEEWDVEKNTWNIKPQIYTVHGSFVLPESVEDGEYILAVSIVDPAGLTNAAVFLNTGYITGGYTALGVIGVGQNPGQDLPFSMMTIPERDYSLRYDLNLALHKLCSVPELTDGLSCTSWTSGSEDVVIDLRQKKNISSVSIESQKYDDMVEIMISDDGESWKAIDKPDWFMGKDREQHIQINARGTYLKFSFTEGNSISQIRVYGR